MAQPPVLIACDLGPTTAKVVEAGLSIAERLGAPPALLHVDPHGLLFSGDYHATDPEEFARMQATYRDNSIRAMQRVVVDLGRDPADLDIAVRQGRPGEEIAAHAASRKAQVIVVGALVRTGLEGWLVGRTAVRVIRTAPCAVMTVDLKHPWRSIARVLCATDLVDSSHEAEGWAARLAGCFGAHLSLVYVSQEGSELPAPYVFPPNVVDQVHQLRSRQLERVRRSLADQAARQSPGPQAVESHLIFAGDPAHAIVKLAAEDQADLVVVGTHGRRGIARAFLGSVAEGVLRHAGTSVLTVPRAEVLAQRSPRNED